MSKSLAFSLRRTGACVDSSKVIIETKIYSQGGGFGAMSNMNKNILPLLTHEINIKTKVRSKKVNTKCITRTFCLGFPSSQLCCWQQPVWPNLSLRRRRVQNGQEDKEERGRNRKLSQSGDFHFCSPHLIL